MSHYFLGQGLENRWSLVRETPQSQEFTVDIGQGLEALVDLHYAMPNIATATIVYVGRHVTKGIMKEISQDLINIILRHNPDCNVLEMNIVYTDKVIRINETIIQQDQEMYALVEAF